MLTFQSTLERNAFPVWRDHYVSYLELKALVQKLQRRATFLRRHATGNEAAPCLPPEASDFEAAFVANCVRVEDWYSARLDEFSAQFALVARQWDALATSSDDAKSKTLKTSCIELHRLVHGLYNYARLNYTALRKILKKYLKKCPMASANHDKLQTELHCQAFATAEAAQRLAADLEAFYTVSFHDNDRVLALSELDGWKDDALDWRHVYIGLKMGVCLVLTLWVVWHYVFSAVSSRVVLSQTKAYPVYRGVALLLFFHWLWGLTQFVLRSARIDYLYVLRCFITPTMFTESDDVPSECSRNAYYTRVAVPLICAVPVWWRFLQSLRRCYELGSWFPGLPNALKYALAQLVILFGLFHSYYSPLAPSNSLQVVWVCLFVCSSLYSWVWDVVMDWGVGRRPRHEFLATTRIKSRRHVYYAVAIGIDLVLSFSWTLALIPPDAGSPLGTLLLSMQPMMMFMEPMRRAMWSCLAIKNEHLRNTLGFQSTYSLPLHLDPPSSLDEGKASATTYVYKIAALSAGLLCLSQKTQLHELQRNGGRFPIIGGGVLVFCFCMLVYSITCSILAMFGSTSCLMIAGGDGC
ncbi:hypothetical protein SPRG_19854 [Saprolegnia parasitica CBS 223.65]|uniref:SPX domain-containing protein n=1 Tax=Saprolegnia parasitica (strain CBS 223.65) TaxID=695850 RepID=A0A067CGN5_SAPPC|nr:hypothetical protein SPRG_19854 [Saprolegnia parasitica CBS 223.65]KDO29924.1 hypothetical protein SPRG_19854 [Saprolegnia parasitica CBS 223.65]|eukprot:XP_012199362.1 hypothetical protein SPRG_19854 [Saprolegnia parasitica CBS 223.65]